MTKKQIEIDVSVDAGIFYKFSMFENFWRRQALRPPAMFASIMAVSAILCFIMDGALLGVVLLVIGLGLPIYNVLKYIYSVKAQIKAAGLETPKPVYSLRFTCETDGISAANHGEGNGESNETARFEWGGVHGVYRLDGCIYLYVLPNKAYLLPDGQVKEGADALWRFFTDMLPREKLHDQRNVNLLYQYFPFLSRNK